MEEKDEMKYLKRIPVVVLLLVCFLCFAHPNAATAATQVVTSDSTFISDLASGYYLNTFSGLTTGVQLPASIAFSGGSGPFSYTANDLTSFGLFSIPGVGTAEYLTTYGNGADLGFTFLSGNVTAVGGNFFSTDTDGELTGDSITLLLSDGTTTTITSSSLSSFVGFLSPGVFITSLDISPGTASDYATVANFYVGDYQAPNGGGTTPEPATFGLLAGALSAGGLLRKRMARV
jgi:hypothetical protein